MRDDLRALLDRAVNALDSPESLIAARYISLINRRLHKLTKGEDIWGVIGASLAIKEGWLEKFGSPFVPRSEPIIETSDGNLTVIREGR
jgi:hypothetical protein